MIRDNQRTSHITTWKHLKGTQSRGRQRREEQDKEWQHPTEATIRKQTCVERTRWACHQPQDTTTTQSRC